MPLNSARARQLLGSGDLRALFIEELGWDRHNVRLDVIVGGSSVTLQALAQKRGMVAYQCATPPGERLPDYARRRKIEQQAAKSAHEHLIVFTDAGNETQIWQWVKREPGKPAACREHTFHRSQPGDALLQKLEAIVFTLAEEEQIALPDVTRRARAGFDVERITKQFYDRFQKEHAAFLKFITGITESADREWYASVMLNRLMFVYFVQRKGFLDGDRDYLRNRLARLRSEQGKNKFYSFYRYFLLRLFHEGLGGKKRTQELEKLIGRIPYLNGGLFDVHELERSDSYGKDIQIPDQAFERIFDYFDQYQWHLDERPLRADNEINPDVLGYIFEKYINQKQMGAYYTKEDITEYISKNTVLPFLFDAARPKCKMAFENPGGPTVWDLLKTDPDRYVYPAVRHGVDEPLPAEIVAGVEPKGLRRAVDGAPVATIESRKAWTKPAPPSHGLPTETWREVVERRRRYEEVKGRLSAGDVRSIDDLITLNLDIRQFAQDVIENCEGPDLLRAFWQAIEKITILDPACGSGAFLFAALNVLEPLYEACLDRMEAFVEDLARSGQKQRPDKFSDFRDVLARVDAHPNRRYFIFKSIILNNLFGVDIMEEAVEICKLRLFLKLAAQVEPDAASSNFGIEPLPDIDFNIRAGNTLVGYATYEDVKRALGSKLDFENAAERIEAKAGELQQVVDAFRAHQIEGDGAAAADEKEELRKRLKALDAELDRYLAGDFGADPAKKDSYAKWLKSHQPFHWFVEFYAIMNGGGFDVTIGNPPYIELKEITTYKIRGYACESAGNIYAVMMERAMALGGRNGRQGFIVPVSSISTDRYEALQRLLASRRLHYSSFDDRPSRLFDGLEHIRLTIHLYALAGAVQQNSTRYNKWSAVERSVLFKALKYACAADGLVEGSLPKLTVALEADILRKLHGERHVLASYYVKSGGHEIYYSRKVGYFLQIVDFEPRVLDGRGERRPPSEFKSLRFGKKSLAQAALCCLNSSLFYWFITVFSDCRHVNKREVDSFPVRLDVLSEGPVGKELQSLAAELMADLKANSENRTMRFKHDTLTVQCIFPKHSKGIIDRIDTALARHYGFTAEELDFLVNYDIKYRMGAENEGEDAE
ncbi:MAG TPA: DNA methyltransferase [Candidatus Baltobacteraceae bacterium]|nr:DNA methyltransferase [Candidatus Baltobacteraceae bacterium]